MLPQRDHAPAPAFLPAGFVDPAPAILDRFDALQAGADPDSPAWRAEAIQRAELRRIRAAGPCGRRLAEADLAHLRRGMPAPAPLPSLRDALARRAAVFGPVDLDSIPDAPLGAWQAIGAAARRAVEALADRIRA